MVLGADNDVADHESGHIADPLQALESAVLPALQRTPCVVSFSGGMDSSFVLAVATRVARREGLPDPIPVTWRFDDAPAAEESDWQDAVFRSLGLTEWTVLRAGDDLDLLGPTAQRLLLTYGVVFPANLHLHEPIITAARGGALLTGFGGDQMLAGWNRPAPTLGSHLPDRVRVRLRSLRRKDPLPWLHPGVSRLVQRRRLQEHRSQPAGLGERMRWHRRRREVLMTDRHFAEVATDHDVLAVHPLLDHGFHRAVGDWTVPTGLAGRAEALGRIAREVLPQQAWLARPKANFREVFVRSATRQFLRDWTGGGTDSRWVDEEALQNMWRAERAGSALLIQQTWLNQQRN